MRGFFYSLSLVVGIAVLVLAVNPLLSYLTPFKMVKEEMKAEMQTVCTTACCTEEVQNMTFGFGFYTAEKAECWGGFKNVSLQCVQGTYCLYEKWYEKEKGLFIKGENVRSPLWYERDVNG